MDNISRLGFARLRSRWLRGGGGGRASPAARRHDGANAVPLAGTYQDLRHLTGSAAPKPTLHGCCDNGYGLSPTYSTFIAGVTAPLAAVPGPGAYPICKGDNYS